MCDCYTVNRFFEECTVVDNMKIIQIVKVIVSTGLKGWCQ